MQPCSSRLAHQQFKWSDDAARFRGTPWPLVTWLKFSTIFSVQETIRFPIRDRSPYRFRMRYSLHILRHCSGQCKHVHLLCCFISKLARGNTATNVGVRFLAHYSSRSGKVAYWHIERPLCTTGQCYRSQSIVEWSHNTFHEGQPTELLLYGFGFPVVCSKL